jgi:hypothetical protein
VFENAVMQILALVRNFIPSHAWVAEKQGWNFHSDSASLASAVDVVSIHAQLHPAGTGAKSYTTGGDTSPGSSGG